MTADIPSNAHATSPSMNVDYVLHGVGPREIDPFELGAALWPDDKWASYQRRVVYSVWNNVETTVKAGNKLGKDYKGGFIATVGFLTRHPCRIITTSAKDQHLRVLWGEIGERIRRSRAPLDVKRGGPLIINHQSIGKMVDGERCPLSYIMGMVAGADSMASMQGHHIALTGDGIWRTMFMCDEASSVNHEYYRMARSWFNRAYIFGNPWPCNNFFWQAFKGTPGTDDKGGDIPRDRHDAEREKRPIDYTKGYRRKVFTLRAQDSPNVRYGEAEVKAGLRPSNRILVPGLKPYDEYVEDRRMWDIKQQTVSLDGEFYEGAEVRMFPQQWIMAANELAKTHGRLHPGTKKQRTKALGIGVDCAMGGDDTAMCAVDECGILELVSKKTPDTNVIVGEVEAFVKKWSCPWESVFFDIGGGGKQHADRLRARGRNLRTITFNASPADDVDLLHTREKDRHGRQDVTERRQVYRDRRSELYGNLRELMDPALLTLPPQERAVALKAIMGHGQAAKLQFYGFAIPEGLFGTRSTPNPFNDPHALSELNRQMGPIPLEYDEYGRMFLIPKHPRPGDEEKPSLTGLLGCSPDELEACVLAIHAMLRGTPQPLYL